MKVFRHIFVFVAMATSAGCLKSTNFQCDTSAQCGGGGQCEGDGFCSFPSSSCASGRAYGDNSGPNSGECVGGGGDGDGGTEPMPGEAGGEPLPMGCRADYMMLANSGPRGHRYLLINTTATWTDQRNACATNMGFLAFPDGAALGDAQLELSAIVTLGGAGLWVGLNDIGGQGQEGKFRTSLNQPASTITQMLITENGNSNNEDCLAGNATPDMTDEDCATLRKAVCECVP